MILLFGVLALCSVVNLATGCTVTTASGTHAPSGFCAGDLIFEDNFNFLDESRWRHARTLAGGGNWEFQWYDNDRNNSFVTNGICHLRPTFTSDIHGEAFLTSGRVIIPPGECTETQWFGCDRQGTATNIINPTRSARFDTWNSFRFRFGTMEVRAKMPAGDWIWPALWMMPRFSVYGGWPASGEIDLMEMRSNRALFSGATHVGNQQAGSTLHFGPRPENNAWPSAHYTRNQLPPFSDDFHNYRLTWTPAGITFYIDNHVIGVVNAGAGFWARGGFAGTGLPNPWAGASIMAPFDQEFYIIINNAIGGINFFADSFVNQNGGKPWLNTSPTSARDFWNGRSQWQSSWNLGTTDSHLQIDYVRVWAV